MSEVIEQATLTVDGVIFACADNVSVVKYVLLIKGKYGWCLPGGKVRSGEEIEQALIREINEEIDVFIPLWTPVGTFAKVDRDPRGRYVSFASVVVLATWNQIHPHAQSDATEWCWWKIDGIPPLAYDHEQIIAKALEIARGAGR